MDTDDGKCDSMNFLYLSGMSAQIWAGMPFCVQKRLRL